MMNIDKDIIKATSQEILWSVNEFYIVKENLEKTEIEVSYWEEENWAELIIDKQIIGYLWIRYPVMFILDKYYFTMNRCLSFGNYLSVIRVKSLTNKDLTLSKDILSTIFNTQFDSDNFSVEDLWFNTNT